MLRFRSNWRTIFVSPVWLEDVIFPIPGIIENSLSSGVATVEDVFQAESSSQPHPVARDVFDDPVPS
jgi:hypothetical protein